ncbi:MAG: TlpA disulfide reductase family protein [Akkermansiaceae bacterium]
MKTSTLLSALALTLLPVLSSSATAGTAAQAEALVQEYQRSVRLWETEYRLAKTPREQQAVTERRPKPADTGARLREAIRGNLGRDWTLPYCAWLLENDPTLRDGHQRSLLMAVESHHTLSPKVGRFCIALVNLRQSSNVVKPGTVPLRKRGLALLKTIRTKNPDPKVQGQAALAISMMMAALGDDHRIIGERRTYLREAIIKSAEVKVGNTTVAKLAAEEIYKMKNLSKGSTAIDVVGVDSGGRPLQLSAFRGKVVMLVFWSSYDLPLAQMSQIMKLLRKTVDSHTTDPFVMLGVNRDSRENLRALEADSIATWRSFSDTEGKISHTYRVSRWPYCIVIDKKGIIRYSGNLGTFAHATANDLLRQK